MVIPIVGSKCPCGSPETSSAIPYLGGQRHLYLSDYYGHLKPSETFNRTMAIASTLDPSRSFLVRPANDADVPAIVDIGTRVFTEAFAYTMTPLDLETYLGETYTIDHIRDNLKDPNLTFLVATTTTQAKQCAGFAVVRKGSTEPCITSYANTIELLRMYVDNAFHGSGVAKLLMEESMAMAKAQGYQNMWLGVYEENFKAQKFYKKFDFEQVGSHDFRTGDTITTDFIWIRPL